MKYPTDIWGVADTHINAVVGWRCKRAPDACCASDPTSNVPPLHTPAERLASPPLRGSRSRPLFPDSLQLLNLYLILHNLGFLLFLERNNKWFHKLYKVFCLVFLGYLLKE